jgi:hypothetical protein
VAARFATVGCRFSDDAEEVLSAGLSMRRKYRRRTSYSIPQLQREWHPGCEDREFWLVHAHTPQSADLGSELLYSYVQKKSRIFLLCSSSNASVSGSLLTSVIVAAEVTIMNFLA